jgi:hypothetical protein
MMKFAAIFGTVLATAAAAFAQAPATTTSVGPDNDALKVICVTHRETGSLTRRTRTCKTRAAWELFRRENQEHVEKVQQYKPHSDSD